MSTQVLRSIAGYGAVACALPYLGLKFVWLAGGEFGVADPQMMQDASMVALNVMTAGMDVVGIALALVFTRPFGMRVPGWLVLPPMWVATGLLGRFALVVPVAALVKVLAWETAPRVTVSSGLVQRWVYAVVYTEFAGLGVGLMVAFLFYARARWAFAFQGSPLGAGTGSGGVGSGGVRGGCVGSGNIGGGDVGATRSVYVPLAYAAAVMGCGVALWHLAWMFGATVGLSAPIVARRTMVSHAVNAIDAGMTLAGVMGVMAMVRGLGLGWLSSGRAVVLTWIGGGALFAWGLWHLINVLGNTALIREHISALAVMNFVALIQLLAGVVIGVVMLFVLAEKSYSFTPSVRRSPGPGVQV